MRNAALLGTSLLLGSYLAEHGDQTLFGMVGGPAIGLTPPRVCS